MKKELKQGDYVMVGDAESGYHPGIIVDGPFRAKHGVFWFEVNMDGRIVAAHVDTLVDFVTFDYEMQHGVAGA
jgi:hypothetical protein